MRIIIPYLVWRQSRAALARPALRNIKVVKVAQVFNEVIAAREAFVADAGTAGYGAWRMRLILVWFKDG